MPLSSQLSIGKKMKTEFTTAASLISLIIRNKSSFIPEDITDKIYFYLSGGKAAIHGLFYSVSSSLYEFHYNFL